MVLGIIGKVGSGKSTVVKYLQKEYRAIYFSCDKIAKLIITEKKINLNNFNPGELFTNKNIQEEVRTVLHKEVFNRISLYISILMNECNKNNFLNKNNQSELFIIIESALPNDDMFKMCDKMIYIKSSFEDRAERLQSSREYTIEKTKLISDAQDYYEKFYDRADYCIDNSGTKEDFLKKVKEVIDEVYIVSK